MRKAWSHLPLILVLGLALLPGVMSDPGSSGRPGTAGDTRIDEIKVDLTTRSGINRYLRSLGLDPSEAVIQRGVHNYAGPNCPGEAWSCTEGDGVVVQLASHDGMGHNKFECDPAFTGTDPDTNTCVIVQESENGRNRAVCRERDRQEEGTIEQSCTITQTNVNGDNIAVVDQWAEMKHHETTQRVEQRSRVTQLNATGDNLADVKQDADLSTKARHQESTPVTQEQDVLQDSVVNQKSGCAEPGAPVPVCPEGPVLVGVEDAGDNRADVFQSHRLKVDAKKTGSVSQRQNANLPSLTECNESPNVCSVAEQTSTDGQLRIDVRQVQRHDADAGDVTGTVSQQQGSSDFTGGLEAVNHQDSFGLSRRSKVQDERQFVDVDDSEGPACPPLPDMPCQLQFTGIGPKLNSNQMNHFDNFAFGSQNVVQMASDPTYQQATLEAEAGLISGQATFRQSVRQNDATESQTVTGGPGFVFALIRCQQGDLPGEEEPTLLQEEPCFASSDEGEGE